MKRATSLVTSGGFLLFVLAACSGSGGSEGGGGTCAQYVNAVVSYFDRCSGVGSALTNARARLEAACTRAIAAPGATNVAGQLSACSQKLQSASCGDDMEDSDCDLTGGTLEDGAPCGERYQCKGGACRKDADASCGKCAQRSPIGGDCRSSGDCVEDATCLTSNGSGKCVAIKTAKAGEKCTGESGEIIRCDAGLRCALETGERTCKPLGAAGADCTSRLDCANDLKCVNEKCATGLAEGADCDLAECGKGLECGKDKKCARVVYVKAGEECDATRRCERGDCKGATVESGPGGTEVKPGKCVDPLPDGAACNAEDEDAPSCDVFARCVGGKCTVDDPAQCK